MSAEGIGRTVIWIAIVLVVIIILAVVVLKLLAYLVVAPYAFGEEVDDNKQKEVDKETIDIGNDTEVTVTCTSNIPNLVSCD
jgi:hypothetical protein